MHFLKIVPGWKKLLFLIIPIVLALDGWLVRVVKTMVIVKDAVSLDSVAEQSKVVMPPQLCVSPVKLLFKTSH